MDLSEITGPSPGVQKGGMTAHVHNFDLTSTSFLPFSSQTLIIDITPQVRAPDLICNIAHHQKPADSFKAWFQAYLAFVIGIAVLGGQITFTLIVSQLADPPPQSVFSMGAVRHLIAAAWLLFTGTLGVGVITSLLFTDDRRSTRTPGISGLSGFVITFLLNFLPLGAFLLLALAAAAYTPVVGWIGVGGISLFGLLVLYYWIFGW